MMMAGVRPRARWILPRPAYTSAAPLVAHVLNPYAIGRIPFRLSWSRRTRVTPRNLFSLMPFVLAALAGAARAAPADPAPRWPLDLPTRYLTSSFMEPRPGRYHAGLDLKTQSRTGLAVHAVEDGWISRVRAENGAYGRAVYVHGVSGRTTVYAHLSRFSDRILALVEAKRAASGVYRVRLQLEPERLPVKAGEVLGLSGESGTTGPHLHFEVRDDAQRPLNPLAWGFAVPDTFPPVIHAVTAHLAAAPATGSPLAVAVGGEGALTGTTPPLEMRGPVAFSARITDQADIRDHVLAPWLIEVRLDGRVVYRCRNERFAFADNNQLRLERCDVEDGDGATVLNEHWLFRRPGVDVPGREGGPWYLGDDGAGLPAGDHVLTITAQDRAGGRTELTVPLRVDAAGRDAAARLAGWDAADDAVDDGHGGRLTPFLELPGNPPVVRRALDPATGDPVLAPTVLWIVPWSAADDPTSRPAPGLDGPFWGARYLAADWPLDGDVRVAAAGAPAEAGLWIFRWHRDAWKPVGPLDPGEGGAGPGFALADRGLHAVFADRTAPWIDPAALAVTAQEPSTVPGVTLPRWTTVPVAVVDKGTGVAEGSLAATLDGAPLIVEPDLIRDRVLVTVPDATAPGRHALRLEAADEAGNTAARTIAVEVR